MRNVKITSKPSADGGAQMAGTRGSLQAVIGVGMAWLLLMAAIQVGLYVPKQETISAVTGASALDYSALAGSFSPLSRDYIAQVLGSSLGAPTSSAGSPVRGAGDGTTVVAAAPGSPGTAPGATVVEHAATNDDFADAYPISSVPFTAKTDSSDATREPGEPSDCAPTGGTLWYRYQGKGSVGLVVNTVGSDHAISLAVYKGESLRDLRQTYCNTNVQGNAWIGFSAIKGTSYYLQVTAPVGGGALTLNVDPVGPIHRASESSAGQEGNEGSGRSGVSISADGRYIAFESGATNLVPNDTNLVADVFVHDAKTRRTERVSVASDGGQANDRSEFSGPPAISANGRYVAFFSWASNLVPNDLNGWEDVFVHDRKTGRTTRVSITSNGQEGRPPAGDRGAPQAACSRLSGEVSCVELKGLSISGNGRFVAFEHILQGLTPNDNNNDGAGDIFVHDRKTGRTTLASVNSSGEQGDGYHEDPVISRDGRYVAFEAYESRNLTQGSPPNVQSIYLRDRKTEKTTLISRSSWGEPGNRTSRHPSISADGSYVAFGSSATNLVPGDTNGYEDAFVHDRRTGQTTRVSVTASGKQQRPPLDDQHDPVILPSISGNGRYVAFPSAAVNLVPSDSNDNMDVFIRDRLRATTTLVSNSATGPQGDSNSIVPALSASGKVVAFWSFASNLVEGDGNGVGDVFVRILAFVK